MRPKRWTKIIFKLFKDEEDIWRQGIVTKVGKTTGKHKNDAWINEEDGDEDKKYNFPEDVEEWYEIVDDTKRKSVTFEKEEEKEEQNRKQTIYFNNNVKTNDMITDRIGVGKLLSNLPAYSDNKYRVIDGLIHSAMLPVMLKC